MKCSKHYTSKACKPKGQVSVYNWEPQEIPTLGKQQRAKKNRLPLHFLRSVQQNYTHKVFLQLILSEFIIPKRCISNSFTLAKQESLCCTNSRERPHSDHSQPSRTVSCLQPLSILRRVFGANFRDTGQHKFSSFMTY